MAAVTVTVSGIPEVDARLQYLADKSARRIGRAAATKMVATYARSMRRFVPDSVAPKTSDKGIGSRSMRSRGSRVYAAKAGIGVGRAQKNALNVVNRGRRKGVGVTAKNLHWFALGTDDRFTGAKKSGKSTNRASKYYTRPTGNKRRFTGRIDREKFGGFIQRGVTAVELEAIAQAQLVVDRLLEEEVSAARSVA